MIWENESFISGNSVRTLVKLIWSGWCLVLHVWITGVRVKSFQNSSLAYFLLKNHFWTKHATCSDPHSCQRTTPWLQMFTRYSHPCPFTQICIQAHLQQCCMDGWVCMCIKLVLMIKRSLHAFYSWESFNDAAKEILLVILWECPLCKCYKKQCCLLYAMYCCSDRIDGKRE